MSPLRLRIRRVEIVPIGGPLEGEIASGQRRVRERRGLLLHLFDDTGTLGLGEATPLPGYSPDDLEMCQKSLISLDETALELDLDAPLPDQLSNASLPAEPAARFAAETAILDLLGRRLGLPLWHLLRKGAPPASVPLVALLPGGPLSHVLAAARRAQAQGMSALKLKIGQAGRWDEERRLIATLRTEIELPLRLDANRAWGPTEAIARLQELSHFTPEFVEEPCRDVADLPPSPVPVAIDESLARADAARWLPDLLGGRCQVLVLKPALLGGFGRCLELAAQARAFGAKVVVTHLFDGPVALAAAAQLALSLPSPPLPCGLSRHGALSAFPAFALPGLSTALLTATDRPGLGIGPSP